MITSDEGQLRAAYIMQNAAESMKRSAESIEYSLSQFRCLLEDGYGNNATRLIELLSKQEYKP